MNRNKKIRGKKSALIGLLALGVIGAGAAGSLAYLTDSEQHVNIVTVGDVKTDLTEEHWDENEAKDAVPNEVVPKDPQVINSGVNDEVVFITVTAPIKEVTKVSADGTKGTKAEQEIFYFQKADDKGKQANSWNLAADGEDGWRLIQIDTETKDAGLVDNATKTATYTFAYNKKLEGSTANDGSAQTAENKKTSKLFDAIQMKNVIETELTAGEAENIVVKAYAIQASDIIKNDNEAATYGNEGKYTDAELKAIFGIVNKQGTLGNGNVANPSIPEANTNNTLNLKGADLAPAEPQNP